MSENIFYPKGAPKADIYEAVLPQISAFADKETSRTASLANTAAILKEVFDFFWVGFYLVENGALVLGPFQGPLACTRIRYGKGVCGTCWAQKSTVLVDDVEQFPGHIACSSASRSEIVVPVIKNGEVVAVLDVDSDKLSDFDATDKRYLEKLCQLLCSVTF